MKMLVIVALALGVVVLVVFAIGALLPKAHTASRSRVVARPPAEVYAKVRDVASAPKWRAVERVEVLDQRRFREYSKHGSVTYEIVADKPPETFATRIADEGLGYSGTWTWRFEPDGAGTRVTLTEDGEVSNLLFRFMARFVFGHTKGIEETLSALG